MSRPVDSERIARAYIEATDVAAMEKVITNMEKVITNMRDRLLVRILFHLGCRVSEALALKVKDIDFNSGTVIIQHLRTRMKISCPQCSARLGKSHTYCPECGGKVEEVLAEEKEHRRVRILPIDNNTLDMLSEYIQRGGPVVKDGKQLIFGINRHRAWQIVTGCAGKAGLPKLINPETGRTHNVSPHRLRDCFSIHAVKTNDTGDGLRMLQGQLGHASIATTMRYRKIAGDELRQWYNSLWEKKDGK